MNFFVKTVVLLFLLLAGLAGLAMSVCGGGLMLMFADISRGQDAIPFMRPLFVFLVGGVVIMIGVGFAIRQMFKKR